MILPKTGDSATDQIAVAPPEPNADRVTLTGILTVSDHRCDGLRARLLLLQQRPDWHCPEGISQWGLLAGPNCYSKLDNLRDQLTYICSLLSARGSDWYRGHPSILASAHANTFGEHCRKSSEPDRNRDRELRSRRRRTYCEKAFAGVAAGTGIAVLAVTALSWLWDLSRTPFSKTSKSFLTTEYTGRVLCPSMRALREGAHLVSSWPGPFLAYSLNLDSRCNHHRIRTHRMHEKSLTSRQELEK
jgi:hypothetical protein